MELNMKFCNKKGFSLVELLVAVAISGVVSAGIIGFFISQQKANVAQEQVTYTQQNIRAGLGIMSRELRMAGYDPLKTGNMNFSNPSLAVITSDVSQITFRMDLNGNGVSTDAGEEISYLLDTVTDELKRRSNNGGIFNVLAEGIEGLAFAYAYDSNANNALDTDAGGNVIYAIAGPATTDGVGPLNGSVNWFQVNADGSTTDTGTAANATDIRAVRIWLLAKTGTIDRAYTNNNTYIVGTQKIQPNDNLRRRLLDTVVSCRNL